MSYVPLWCKSNFSFLEGASHPDELVERGAYARVAGDCPDRSGRRPRRGTRACEGAGELGVRLIVGAEVTVGDGGSADVEATVRDEGPAGAEVAIDDEDPAGARVGPGTTAAAPAPTSTCILLAMNRTGYANLCRLITTGRLRRPKGESCVTWPEVRARAEGLIALLGGERSVLAREEEPRAIVVPMREAFGDRLYAMVSRHRRAEDGRQEARVRRHAGRAGLPLVATTEVLYHTPDRRDLQDVLTCIDRRVTLATAGRMIRPNAEHDLKAPEAMARLFADAPGLLERTREVASRCTFTLSEIPLPLPRRAAP